MVFFQIKALQVCTLQQCSLFCFRSSQECRREWAQVHWWPLKLLLECASPNFLGCEHLQGSWRTATDVCFPVWSLLLRAFRLLGLESATARRSVEANTENSRVSKVCQKCGSFEVSFVCWLLRCQTSLLSLRRIDPSAGIFLVTKKQIENTKHMLAEIS